MPPSIAKLPRDERGYPCPWFISWIDGKPEFRVMDGKKLDRAVKENLCWVCGEPFTDNILAFISGPMCLVNLNSAEPPSHLDCARFSVKACPFLTMPKAQRRDANLPSATENPAGFYIARNPGCCAIAICNRYRTHQPPGGGMLFRMPTPQAVEWYAEGRPATREEVLASIDSGLPSLAKVAQQHGEMGALNEAIAVAQKWLPA